MFGLLLLSVSVAVTIHLQDLPQNLMIFMSFLGTTFFLANGIEHMAGRNKDKAITEEYFNNYVVSLNSVLTAQKEQMNELKNSGEKLAEEAKNSSTALSQLVGLLSPKK